jgi:dimethylargininase
MAGLLAERLPVRPMEIALTRDVSPSLQEAELTYLDRQPIDFERAVAQHDAYCDALSRLGLRIVRLPADPGCPDCCFVEDAAVVLDELAVVAAPTPVSRRAEVPAIADALAGFRSLARLPPQAHLEGGDVLRLGRTLYVGLSSRTNQAGIVALAHAVEPFGYRVEPVAVTGCLHLKSAVTAIGEEAVLVNPDWIDIEAFADVAVLPVHTQEPGAGNVLLVRGVLLAHSGFPRTLDVLDRYGFAVEPLDMSEFVKAEAGVTCKSLLFREASR